MKKRDSLYKKVLELSAENNGVSVSMLRSKMGLGFNRAKKIVKHMEEDGFCLPQGEDKNLPRKVVFDANDKMTKEDKALLRELSEKNALAIQSNIEKKKDARSAQFSGKHEIFLNRLDVIIKSISFPNFTPYKSKKNKPTERALNLVLSDLHYGANLRKEETSHVYGPVEEARRTAAVVLQAAEYKRHYREQTELNVHLLGDIIQGKLHDPQDAAPLAEQWSRALWNLRQALAFLATEFKKVTVHTAVGNHGRTKERHPDRAVNQKWDSEEYKLYMALKTSLLHMPNIEVILPMTPYYIFDAFGSKGFMTHGDTVLNFGYPGKAINVGSLRNQINEINMGRVADGSGSCQLFGGGHVHILSTVRLPNKVIAITNGCLIPNDEFAQSIGIMSATCGQQIFESVPGYIFGDHRDAIVDFSTDKEASLDKIVQPFPGLKTFT